MSNSLHRLMQDFETSTRLFLDAFDHISDDLFVRKPLTGWSIAEVVEHVNISDKSAAIACMRSNGLPKAEEALSAQAQIDRFMAMEKNKLEAPAAAEPKGIFETVTQATHLFQKTRQKLWENASIDPQFQATGFAHPRLGFLTRQQWLEFVIWHANRHGEQILRIRAEFSSH